MICVLRRYVAADAKFHHKVTKNTKTAEMTMTQARRLGDISSGRFFFASFVALW
jgi:hypothetical protein